ncbi:MULTISPECIES: cytochrome c maturation protein CcmE [Gordonibacter]|uniref:Cytochrome c maturation protein CcmE n=1 Tax=Gordonibacter faecis TaxID=3047475 RepID=A0ABT7DLD7_9ACTN|nr:MULTISPECIES: cytochrome c maturation protein CcmE [unclassified Gordonibacter]MDJ1650349.1 cytochrome c maturation protein CcmE [Gordonibacter sp. KGMB12511]HIW76804.1 cytochrome c maturation protein CcmE [Candidatus Gordonibacter avicola]
MNAKTKRRLVVVTGIIIIVLVVVLAVVGGSSSAKAVTVADAVSGQYQDQKIQVSGNVVENSFKTEGNVLTFDIYDPDGDPMQYVRVSYEGGVAATFGNDVTAICTGKVGADGVLRASELVTKCPSKYENATDALGVAQLLDYGDSVLDKTVKVAGTVKAGTLAAAGQGDRFVLVDAEGTTEMPVVFDDALSDEVKDGSSLVLTGSINADGKFHATNVALEG